MLSTVQRGLGYDVFGSSKRFYARLPSVSDMKDSMKILKHSLVDGRLDNILPCPRECDVLIIGGSVVGSSIAYSLKEKQNKLNVMVVEQDSSYSRASALLSVGGMRQQFSCRENIEMSQFGFEFLRRANELLSVKGEAPPDVHFNHGGYLMLGDKEHADDMLKSHEIQAECGAITTLLTPSMLKKKYPWINTEGIELASVGIQGEGWFDPAALLAGLKGKNKYWEVPYINGKVIGFEYDQDRLRVGTKNHVLEMTLVQLANGDIQPVKSGIIVNAAGPWAGEIASMAGVGDETIDDACAVPLPVAPRKRYVFTVHCPNGPGLDCGLVTDVSQMNLYFKRDGLGNHYVCSVTPPPDWEPDHSNLDVNYDYFNELVWPRLAHRVPAFEGLKLTSAWAGYYDYNFIDQNLIIGSHPYFKNLYFSNGSSGHGLQHSPAMGRAISELINYQTYKTVNLDAFSFDRFLSYDDESGQGIASEKNIF